MGNPSYLTSFSNDGVSQLSNNGPVREEEAHFRLHSNAEEVLYG